MSATDARRARTLFEKVWDAHVVQAETAETPAVLASISTSCTR